MDATLTWIGVLCRSRVTWNKRPWGDAPRIWGTRDHEQATAFARIHRVTSDWQLASHLLYLGFMTAAFEIVYQYQQLMAKCESYDELTLDEIEEISVLEERLTAFRSLSIAAELRSQRCSDVVDVVALGFERALCVGCSYLEVGQAVELRVVGNGMAGPAGYRMAASVIWRRQRVDGSYDLGLCLNGTPLRIRHQAFRLTPMLEQIAAAA